MHLPKLKLELDNKGGDRCGGCWISSSCSGLRDSVSAPEELVNNRSQVLEKGEWPWSQFM